MERDGALNCPIKSNHIEGLRRRDVGCYFFKKKKTQIFKISIDHKHWAQPLANLKLRGMDPQPPHQPCGLQTRPVLQTQSGSDPGRPTTVPCPVEDKKC